eukprot:TRINITY_DN11554_c0_g2_i1.p1 TRINITY_DN11554_c0_g2~~TRINITY_DN11554_c0_g2_i1.p1  ORF type:complete len:779 (+),score=125.98 TRINITY_DN11554_c0_g2_i1:69-2405(+)
MMNNTGSILTQQWLFGGLLAAAGAMLSLASLARTAPTMDVCVLGNHSGLQNYTCSMEDYPVHEGLFHKIRAFAYAQLWLTFLAFCMYMLMSVYVAREAQYRLPAFFLPACFMSVYVVMLLQGLLVFGDERVMMYTHLCVYVVGGFLSLCGVHYFSVDPPDTPPLQPGNSAKAVASTSRPHDVLALYHNVLKILDEQNFHKPQPKSTRELAVEDMQQPIKAASSTWKLTPVLSLFAFIAVPVALSLVGLVRWAVFVLILYALYSGCRMGIHAVVFTLVGVNKLKHFDNVDFQAIYDAQRKIDQLGKGTQTQWQDVMHFVIFPNYKEDPEVLKLAVKSVAKSDLAFSQIVLVLAMEAREEGAQAKAAALCKEVGSQFRHCLVTYHPPDLPGEMPGKSSNTKWAAEQVFEYCTQHKIDIANAVCTVGDADSEFHQEYFAALTYYFVNSGSEENETPARYLTIWQPPVLHYKNYVKQPAIVKLCSLIVGTHELSNLADPDATRVPYSTYSISAKLAKAVHGWDPDWISEDWHMCLKCFLATAGRLNVMPIFLPVLNYTPEGETVWETFVGRWTQEKRHALGFCEIVYFLDHFPRIFSTVQGIEAKMQFLWKGFRLWFKLLMVHVVMASLWALGPLNVMLMGWLHPQDFNRSDPVFLLNFVCQSVCILSLNCLFMANTIIYEAVKKQVDGYDDPSLSIRWRSPLINSLAVVLESALCAPFVFMMAAAAEWIAAVKSAGGNRFDYEVALKPNLSKVLQKNQPPTDEEEEAKPQFGRATTVKLCD